MFLGLSLPSSALTSNGDSSTVSEGVIDVCSTVVTGSSSALFSSFSSSSWLSPSSSLAVELEHDGSCVWHGEKMQKVTH